MAAINGQDYIEVTFADAGDSGLDPASIDGNELTLSGDGVGTAVLSGTATLHSGSTYRYPFTGDFVIGPVDVNFVADRWQDNAGNANLAETESFTVQQDPPGVITRVRVRLTDTDYLQLNEVQVLAAGNRNQPGVSRNCHPVEYLQCQHSRAEKAIDGDTSSGYPTSVSLTQKEFAAWWQVDLGAGFDVGTIVIYNRNSQRDSVGRCGRRSAEGRRQRALVRDDQRHQQR